MSTFQDTYAAPHTSDEREGRCDLLSLPSAVLGRLWPPERVVVGLRVCHRLRQEVFSEHAGSILLVKRGNNASEEALATDFRRVSHLNVVLKWRGLPGLACVASLGTALAHLDLSCNGVSNKIGAEGAGILAEVLRECRALAHLDLRYNQIGAEGAGSLAGVLGECRALAHLDLRCNVIGAEGAGSLAGVLGECRALAHLDLSGNRIGAEGAGSLAGVLGECRALAHLALSYNYIGAEGAGSLAGVLGECRALAYLDLSENGIGDEGVGSLAGVLGECRALAHLDLSENGIGAEGAGRLASAGTDRIKILSADFGARI